MGRSNKEARFNHAGYTIETGHGGLKRNSIAYTKQAGESEDTSEQTTGGKVIEKVFDAATQYYSAKAMGEGIGKGLSADDDAEGGE